MTLNDNEQSRYKRQMMMDKWGLETQLKLKNSTVFIAGAGGLGSPVAIYLAVAGVGNIRICDFDVLELSNLNRQILHNDSRVGHKKVESAKQTLTETNPQINIEAIQEKIDADNVDRLVGNSSIILDCMDNFDTRFQLNDCALRKKIPMVHASVWGMEGRLSFIYPPETPCLRCLYDEGPPKEVFPILGATPGVIGSLQALEAIKFLTGIGEPIKSDLLVWDGALMDFARYKIYPKKDCACRNQA